MIDFPLDVKSRIVGKGISMRDAKALAVVTKEWQKAAESRIYEVIDLRGGNYKRHVWLRHALQKAPRRKGLVRTLRSDESETHDKAVRADILRMVGRFLHHLVLDEVDGYYPLPMFSDLRVLDLRKALPDKYTLLSVLAMCPRLEDLSVVCPPSRLGEEDATLAEIPDLYHLRKLYLATSKCNREVKTAKSSPVFLSLARMCPALNAVEIDDASALSRELLDKLLGNGGKHITALTTRDAGLLRHPGLSRREIKEVTLKHYVLPFQDVILFKELAETQIKTLAYQLKYTNRHVGRLCLVDLKSDLCRIMELVPRLECIYFKLDDSLHRVVDISPILWDGLPVDAILIRTYVSDRFRFYHFRYTGSTVEVGHELVHDRNPPRGRMMGFPADDTPRSMFHWPVVEDRSTSKCFQLSGRLLQTLYDHFGEGDIGEGMDWCTPGRGIALPAGVQTVLSILFDVDREEELVPI